MTCQDARLIIDAYLDAELDLTKTLELEQHLKTCNACQKIYQNRLMLQKAIRSGSLYHEPTAALYDNILSTLPRQTSTRRLSRVFTRQGLGIAASIILAMMTIWGLSHSSYFALPDDKLAQDVVASHIRSLMANHLTDVVSSDQHTVKPWFNGKLTFSPTVSDYSADGFVLIGGRLDYLDATPVAALIYKHQQHIINLFIWPSVADSPQARTTRQGYHLVHWTLNGMNYYAVSDLNETDLLRFAALAK
jgi:anti-sigma factor RsiW